MMKKVLFIICVCLFTGWGIEAQNRSIEFIHPDEMSWKQVLKKAKKEKKMIFMDCYTSWCGPCKRLAKEVFTRDSVADFYNQHFVCIKYDAEKDKDKGYIPNNPFGIPAYPTLLYMDSKGNVVHCMVGAYDHLVVGEARKALGQENHLAALAARKQAGEQSNAFLREYVNAMVLASQPGKDQLVIDYLSQLPDEEFYTENSWILLDKQVKDVLSQPFIRMQQNRLRFDSIAGKEKVDFKLMMTFLAESAKYAYWRPGQAFDEERCDRLMHYMQTLGMDRIPVYLLTLSLVKNQYHGNYREILRILKDFTYYNGWGKYLVLYFPETVGRLVSCKDKEVLHETIEWLESLRNNEFYSDYLRGHILKLESRLYESMGNPVAAKEMYKKLEEFAGAHGLKMSIFEKTF